MWVYIFLFSLVGCAAADIWPAPKQVVNGSTILTLDPHSFEFRGPDSTDLQLAFSRYSSLIFQHAVPKNIEISTLILLSVNVQKLDVPLQQGVDESYGLYISSIGTAQLDANTIWGALRGLETFSQLIEFDFSSHTYVLKGAPWSIYDEPRFSYRGLLIDTSRHFQPLPFIKRVVDSLVYAKMNVLHWHMVDSQSFPFESRQWPNLWNGAFSPVERYTHEDVAEVVEYARQRGIRVLAEFDVPGHAESWCTGYPEICPSLTCRTPLDPSNNFTFEFLDGLVKEVSSTDFPLFPERLFHFGGDEVDTSCWTQNPRIQQWLKAKNFTADQAYEYFVDRVHQIAFSHQLTPINWEEVFNHFGSKLDKRIIIHVWLDRATLARVLEAGYQTILSDQDVWYLDHLKTTWQQFYLNEPTANVTDPIQQKLILGGEVCMWGETVDPSDLMQTIWPRAAAAAERLWSPLEHLDVNPAESRLASFRCLLTRRGIDAAPLQNPTARSAPVGPGSCLLQ